MNSSRHDSLPIRGPEWSNAQVTRTSLRVEPISKSQQRQLRQDSIRDKTEQTKQQLHNLFKTYVPGMNNSQSRRSGLQRSLSEKGLYAATHTDDFRRLKKELSATGVRTTNKAVLAPVLQDHFTHMSSGSTAAAWIETIASQPGKLSTTHPLGISYSTKSR